MNVEAVPAPGAVGLRVIGSFGVSVDGVPLPPVDVGSRKARTILALLAVRPEQHVSIDEIVTALWPGRAPTGVVGNVASLVSRLRAKLGAGVIRGDHGRYGLGPDIAVDLRYAGDLVRRAETGLAAGDTPAALDAAHAALRLLGADMLLVEYRDAEWAEPARLMLPQLTRRARLVASEAALRTGAVTDAGAIAGQATAADPIDEAACRLLMRAYAAAGEPARALTAYLGLRASLADELGVDPAPATSELHVAILRHRDPDAPRLPRTGGRSRQAPGGGGAVSGCCPRCGR